MVEPRSLYQRQLSNLDHDLKPIMEELLDPKVTDIMVNPGGIFGQRGSVRRQSLAARCSSVKTSSESSCLLLL